MTRFGTIGSAAEMMADASSSPTPGATINLDASAARLFKWTAGENELVNITSGQQAGRIITLMIVNDATPRIITLSTGIVSTGTIVGTALKTAIAVFQSDGTNFYELSRTLGL
jgi:hypothetical protein